MKRYNEEKRNRKILGFRVVQLRALGDSRTERNAALLNETCIFRMLTEAKTISSNASYAIARERQGTERIPYNFLAAVGQLSHPMLRFLP